MNLHFLLYLFLHGMALYVELLNLLEGLRGKAPEMHQKGNLDNYRLRIQVFKASP